MTNHGKKYIAAKSKLNKDIEHSFVDGIKKVKELAFAKFDESVDVDINVGIDPSKGDQVVRGAISLPFNIGKKARVVVFAKGDYFDAAEKAGADYVGAEDLVQKIEDGWLEFDFAVATPDLMGMVSKVAKILGPRGLVPNKKMGTVTFDVGSVVTELKKGQKYFKNDKNAVVHFSIGRVSLDNEKLYENLKAFVKALAASKPQTSKGKFIKKITISSTMGPGVKLNASELS